jgi:hypothetical protein
VLIGLRSAGAERDTAAAVAVERAEGHTWTAIGAMLGTSGRLPASPTAPATLSLLTRGEPRRGSQKAARRSA